MEGYILALFTFPFNLSDEVKHHSVANSHTRLLQTCISNIPHFTVCSTFGVIQARVSSFQQQQLTSEGHESQIQEVNIYSVKRAVRNCVGE